MAIAFSGAEALSELLNSLDLRAAQEHPVAGGKRDWACQRSADRFPLRAKCAVRFLASRHDIGTLPGRTRNLSKSGVSLLVQRFFQAGDPVEIELQVPGRPILYMAGLVGFCRYAGQGFHEIGVELKASGPLPVFSKNPEQAAQFHLWLPRGWQA